MSQSAIITLLEKAVDCLLYLILAICNILQSIILYTCSHDIINQTLNLELHSKNVIERKNISLYAKANRISCYNTVYLVYRGIINYFDLKMSIYFFG